MLKVFNPSPVQVGSIECLQSAQKLAEENPYHFRD
ncbi:AraC family transcriptional regulator [Salmonella enterica subsp. enterica]|uniref:AraC family transcriptional regulator n=1 Tax=Salmonella enterica I TaxID=59201 RepID=A0A447PQA4_SALET|nr:AraC family transcriptional regulator [Salmonella enterica subsp. enterica]